MINLPLSQAFEAVNRCKRRPGEHLEAWITRAFNEHRQRIIERWAESMK